MAERLPLFPLGTVLFPGMLLPLHIFEPRYRKMIASRIDEDPLFGVVLIRSGNEVGDEPEIHDVGTSASLAGMVRFDDGRYNLALRGSRRFRVQDFDWGEGHMTGSIAWIDGDEQGAAQSDALLLLRNAVLSELDAYLEVIEQTAGARLTRPELATDALVMGYEICSLVPLSNRQRQRLLEMPTVEELLTGLLSTLRHERLLLTATGIGGAAATTAGSRFSVN